MVLRSSIYQISHDLVMSFELHLPDTTILRARLPIHSLDLSSPLWNFLLSELGVLCLPRLEVKALFALLWAITMQEDRVLGRD